MIPLNRRMLNFYLLLKDCTVVIKWAKLWEGKMEGRKERRRKAGDEEGGPPVSAKLYHRNNNNKTGY